ncbi:MAG: hypothetical protein GJ676_16765 [Rhodobacteraceae bacterium]|nr:hypothetical protein [Paracoccaceae bacterium]
MKNVMSAILCAGLLATSMPVQATAGPGVIERACKQSNRTAANPSLCRCIQRAANRSLNAVERRKVAKWFGDPHQAQVVRQSDRSSDERLWLRYKAFGEQARKSCG